MAYYRRDQASGITAPDLSKAVTFAEHIVRARGKRTQFTSTSLDAVKIRDFGDALYQLRDDALASDGHALVEHEKLMTSLRATVASSDKAERARAIQALRYAKKRLEALVHWTFDTSGVEPKNLINWAGPRVQPYFARA
jgi:hypothetical protein